jgi:hypothetical protein
LDDLLTPALSSKEREKRSLHLERYQRRDWPDGLTNRPRRTKPGSFSPGEKARMRAGVKYKLPSLPRIF